MPSHVATAGTVPARRSLLLGAAGTALALVLPAAPASAVSPTPARPFGRFGSPARRFTERTLYVHPGGLGDHATVQAAVTAASGAGWTLVLAAGTYRETVTVSPARTDMTWIGASGDPRDVVVVYANAAGTPRPEGGTLGTTGSATTTVQAAGFTAVGITFANDFLRTDLPGNPGTQAVALKAQGDRSAFFHCRFLGHQDTLYADSMALTAFARQYYAHCHVEGDVDFVFGRATAVFEHCHFRTLLRPDLAAAPFGFVFAPSTARENPHGFLAAHCRVTSEAPDGFYKLARPWVPGSDLTARPSLVVRESTLGPGIDTAAPYANMRDAYPWQAQRFAEYRNNGPGARVTVPENRPRLDSTEAGSATRPAYLGDWDPRPPRWR
ncbi:pectinesterase family protein [Streptomyces sp. NBC_00691]|uniref:pectinesterase family protein n=1 Tax=Streptomyces sp. NBC_00691 TaxID=2903671 RepID=UPI002E332409|nr:pectinesterase family protein [Streptomyces sp. NBC_00691]